MGPGLTLTDFVAGYLFWFRGGALSPQLRMEALVLAGLAPQSWQGPLNRTLEWRLVSLANLAHLAILWDFARPKAWQTVRNPFRAGRWNT